MKCKKIEKRYIEIDLDGPEGNAFYLLSVIRKLNKEILGYTDKENKECIDLLMTKQYEDIVSYIEENFGEVVKLYSVRF